MVPSQLNNRLGFITPGLTLLAFHMEQTVTTASSRSTTKVGRISEEKSPGRVVRKLGPRNPEKSGHTWFMKRLLKLILVIPGSFLLILGIFDSKTNPLHVCIILFYLGLI